MAGDGNTSEATVGTVQPSATPSGEAEPLFVVKEDDLAGLTPQQRQAFEGRLKTYEQGWTKKTMELAEIRKGTEAREAELRAQIAENQKLGKELKDSMQALSTQMTNGNKPLEANPLDQIDPGDISAIELLIDKKLKPLSELVGGLAVNTLDQRTVGAVDDYLKQPGNEELAPFRNQVIQFYREKHGTPDDLPVEVMFKSLHYEALKNQIAEAKKSGQLSALESVTNATRRSVGSGPPQPIEFTPGKTLWETWQNAKRAAAKAEQLT